jgi:histidine triad (HIT) family protein
MADDCVFCNIANRTIASDIVYEDDKFMVVRDVLPQAPVHLLIIPKAHIPSVNELSAGDATMVGSMVLLARDQAQKQGIADTGYKLVFNVGKHGGQTVHHLHLHLKGGKQLGE